MKNFKKIAIAAALSLTFLAFRAGPSFAVTVSVSGNGEGSENSADVSVEQVVQVNQSNTGDVQNDVNANANTGGNQANENTGGDVSIGTGDASTTVDIANKVNFSETSVSCCDPEMVVDVSISGNGTDSDNNIDLDLNNFIGVNKNNSLDIDNHVGAFAGTGDNEANENTGGNVSIETGDAEVRVTITNEGNIDKVNIGGVPPVTPPEEPAGEPEVPPLAPPPPPVVVSAPKVAQENPGEVLGVQQLPVTGGNSGINWLVIFGAILGVFGLVVRRLTRQSES